MRKDGRMPERLKRCGWSENDDVMNRYHDEEWGVPNHDDRRHFEFLVLESAQAGLSWRTVLHKRENYRRAYDGFDPRTVAKYGSKKIEELLGDPGIIRNRRKIEASINNAERFLEVQKEFGSFDAYLRRFTGGRQVVNRWRRLAEIPARTELSDTISADMKQRGFSFVGSTIVYSHLQAVGVVNDHLVNCFRYRQVTEK
jgi:DNA-3-methyladenine glycosylase I